MCISKIFPRNCRSTSKQDDYQAQIFKPKFSGPDLSIPGILKNFIIQPTDRLFCTMLLSLTFPSHIKSSSFNCNLLLLSIGI